MGALAVGEKQGSLSRDEVLGNALLLLVAGQQTTINLIGNGTLALIRHPDRWEQLKRETALWLKISALSMLWFLASL